MNVYYLSLKKETPTNDYWDYGFINDFINGEVWTPPTLPKFKKKEVNHLPKTDEAIVLIPARHHADMILEINKEIKNIKKIILFLMGDEEADFPVEDIKHDNIHIWVQNPHIGRHDKYNKIGTGYPPLCTKQYKDSEIKKELDIFFAGQITHKRRSELQDVMINMQDTTNYSMNFICTRGFTQGKKQEDYYVCIKSAKIAPAPSGAIIPDSFRLFEALESMTIPIADQKTASGEVMQYWDWLFAEATPFPKITEWDRLYGLTEEILEDWEKYVHKQTAWWINWKRNFAYKIVEQING